MGGDIAAWCAGQDLRVTLADMKPEPIAGAIKRAADLYGKILRPPSYGAKLVSIDLAPAKAIKDVVVVQDDQFVGVAAPTTFQAEKALDALLKTAKWETAPHPSSKELFDYLKEHAEGGAIARPASRLRKRAAPRLTPGGMRGAAQCQHRSNDERCRSDGMDMFPCRHDDVITASACCACSR